MGVWVNAHTLLPPHSHTAFLQRIGEIEADLRIVEAAHRIDDAVLHPQQGVAGGNAVVGFAIDQIARHPVHLHLLVRVAVARDGHDEGRSPVHVLAEGARLFGSHAGELQADLS